MIHQRDLGADQNKFAVGTYALELGVLSITFLLTINISAEYFPRSAVLSEEQQ
jgi:hypothetical protein